MKKLIFFSQNKHKLIEIKKIFNKTKIEILSLNDLPNITAPIESENTFEKNAIIKFKIWL